MVIFQFANRKRLPDGKERQGWITLKSFESLVPHVSAGSSREGGGDQSVAVVRFQAAPGQD